MKIRNGKKYLALLMAGVMSWSMAACSKNEEEAGQETTEATISTEVDGTEDTASQTSQLEDFDPEEYITEVNYKGVEMEVEDSTLTDEEFEQLLDNFLSSYAETEEITDRVTEEGDTIVMDYSGTIDGVAFDGGTATYQTVVVGSSGFITDLDEALIGAPCGEEFVVDVTFPDDYWDEDKAGVAAQFTVLIHYIEGDEIVPEWTDEFVQSLEDYDCSTVEEFQETYRQDLAEAKAEYYDYINSNTLWSQLLEDTTFNGYPENYVETYYNDMLSSYETYASYYGIELEEFVSYYGYELDDFYSLLQENAELQVKSDILYRYIAQKEGITATEEDYLEMVQEYMDSTGYTDMAEFVNAYGADVVEEQGYADATLKKVMDFCYQNAVLHVTSAEETTEAAE
jgi:trigger factor